MMQRYGYRNVRVPFFIGRTPMGRSHLGVALALQRQLHQRSLSKRAHASSQQSFAETLCALSPEIAITVDLAKQFRRMMQEHDTCAWQTWRKAARQSPLHCFVRQLQRDAAAVQPALTLPWSTGSGRTNSPTEADQTSDVRASKIGFAADSPVARGLIELVSCPAH